MKDSLSSRVTKPMKGLVGLLSLPLLLAIPLANADETAIDILNRMNHALHQLNYKGTLAYLRGNTLSSLHIEHTVKNGVEGERVVRLNDAGNEVSRELQGFSLASIPRISPEMEKVYSFDIGRENRIANIPCRIITARPKDRERYLQKYCVDSVTGMLLDYMLVGKSHKPVEQFMFTSIEISLPKKEAENTNLVNDASTSVITQNASSLSAEKILVAPAINTQAKPRFRQISNTNLDDGWVMEALPAGYEISQAPSMKAANDQGEETKHYIVSDGLSSLSVFVSPLVGNAQLGSVKINSGALNVVTQQKGNHVITVVGEVPEGTLRGIVKNLRKK